MDYSGLSDLLFSVFFISLAFSDLGALSAFAAVSVLPCQPDGAWQCCHTLIVALLDPMIHALKIDLDDLVTLSVCHGIVVP